jgi:Protein of unknown function (DUF2855)
MRSLFQNHGFYVAKDDLRRWQWEERDTLDGNNLRPGQILVEITKFAFTANNVTYARLGDQIAYWRFFPAAGDWGYIPVWGLAIIIHSRHPEVREGERVYGYFPMATHLVLQPGGLRGARFIDTADHRRELPQTYNEYVLVDRNAGYDQVHEHEHLVLRPLFSLSFFCSEYVKEERFFGARQVLISSPSSKAALGLAFLLAQARPRDVKIAGLTSPANASFVAHHGTYDQVVDYGAISSLPHEPSIFIDIAGDARVQSAVHHALGDSLKLSARAGFTHSDQLAPSETNLPGPAPKQFFTPDHIVRRRNEWGPGILGARLLEAWQGFLSYVAPWLIIELTAGRGRSSVSIWRSSRARHRLTGRIFCRSNHQAE